MPIDELGPGKELVAPRGMWSVTAQKRKGSPTRASIMLNARISPGVAAMRPGTGPSGLVATAKVSTLFNWIKPGTQNLVGSPGGYYHNKVGDLEIQIDNPEGSHQFVYTPVAGVLIIPFFGWAIAGAVNTITNVILVIDGIAPPGVVSIGQPRPDVAGARPGQAGAPNFGWFLAVDASGLTPGGHLVQVVATDSAANNIQAYGIFYIDAPPTAEQNLLIYQEGNVVKSFRQSDLVIVLVLASVAGARALSIAPLDVWVFIAAYDTSGNGTIQVRITDGTNTDTAFRGPIILTACTVADGGPGFCNIGTHLIGFVYQNRTGFAGKPSTTVFSAPISITLTSDNRLIDVGVTLPPLMDGGGNANLSMIMTRADNPARWYFVPTNSASGSVGQQPVPFNSAIDLPFAASISDFDLADSADPADDYFLLFTQDGTGNGPTTPSFVGAYGTRMFYGSGTILFVSDPSKPQSIAADRNEIRMPNQRKFGFAFAMPGGTSLILTGDRWTAYVTDNNDTPSTWGPPLPISDALGAPFPNCVCAKTGGNYTWIATESGVYQFVGRFSDLPVTYLVDDLWKQVNWKAAYAIQIVDDTVAHKVFVGCPFGDGTTEPNAMFVIDYTNGLTYNTVDIGLDSFNPAIFSSLGIIKEVATGLSNLWVGPPAAGAVARFDATLRSDQGNAIESFWEAGLIRDKEHTTAMIRVGGCDVWARGSGTLICWVYGPDKVKSKNPRLLSAPGKPTVLAVSPGYNYVLKFDISQIPNFTMRVGTNAVGDWWELSMLKPYFIADLANR